MARRGLAFLMLLLAACGIPRDPDGTLESVRGGVMRVGITHSDPWIILDGEEPSGVEVELVQGFARELDAEIEWVEGPEAELLESMEMGHLDLAVGGFTADNPWSSRVSFIQPYYVLGEDQHVMAVPHGENAWIVRLERFLRSHIGDIPELLRETGA